MKKTSPQSQAGQRVEPALPDQPSTDDNPQAPAEAVPQLELRVLCGVHQGAALLLIDDALTVGSDDECDVVLLDEGIALRQVRVFRRGEHWICETLDEPAVLDTHGQAVRGEIPIVPGLCLKAAGVWICFADMASPWGPPPAITPREVAAAEPVRKQEPGAELEQRPADLQRAAIWTACAILACLVLAVASLGFYTRADASSKTATLPPAPPAPAVPGAAQLRQAAAEALKEQQLSDLVNVATESGRLTMEGQLNSIETRKFEQALLNLQRRFGATTQIEARLTRVAAVVPFQIRQVVMGADSHLVLADGRSVYEGEKIDTYRLKAIKPGALVFDGNGRAEVPW